MFKETHPILGTRDLEQALDFYIERLGFTLAFRDPSGPDNYAGVRRDGVELHFQWQDESEMAPTRLRFLVEDPDSLFAEYQEKQACGERARLADTPWGTRESALYDLDRNCADLLSRFVSIEPSRPKTCAGDSRHSEAPPCDRAVARNAATHWPSLIQENCGGKRFLLEAEQRQAHNGRAASPPTSTRPPQEPPWKWTGSCREADGKILILFASQKAAEPARPGWAAFAS